MYFSRHGIQRFIKETEPSSETREKYVISLGEAQSLAQNPGSATGTNSYLILRGPIQFTNIIRFLDYY